MDCRRGFHSKWERGWKRNSPDAPEVLLCTDSSISVDLFQRIYSSDPQMGWDVVQSLFTQVKSNTPFLKCREKLIFERLAHVTVTDQDESTESSHASLSPTPSPTACSSLSQHKIPQFQNKTDSKTSPVSESAPTYNGLNEYILNIIIKNIIF